MMFLMFVAFVILVVFIVQTLVAAILKQPHSQSRRWSSIFTQRCRLTTAAYQYITHSMSPDILMEWREEAECKMVHDPLYCIYFQLQAAQIGSETRCVYIDGPIIVGAGPSGLAVAACLKEKGIPSLIVERSDCIASLWQHKTYDRLRLHLPKNFCELPFMSFPSSFPDYPTKQQFLTYLTSYADQFDIKPVFNSTVEKAEYDKGAGLWRVKTVGVGKESGKTKEFLCRSLVVATGENAEAVIPKMNGMDEFKGAMVHTSEYRSGDVFTGKKVLVVGCGNSGMEVCLDLCNFDAKPTIVVREAVHVLPRDMLGKSTFGLSMWLLKYLPVRLVDNFLLLASHLILGDTTSVGLDRPQLGPLELKSLSGKTPVLDVGTLAKIKSGHIKVSPAVKRFTSTGAEFSDGRSENFDAVVFATGYRSNVPYWLKERDFFSEKDGLPRNPFPNGWKGENGLYAVGFTKRGILGASMDAKRIAHDMVSNWNSTRQQALLFQTEKDKRT